MELETNLGKHINQGRIAIDIEIRHHQGQNDANGDIRNETRDQ